MENKRDVPHLQKVSLDKGPLTVLLPTLNEEKAIGSLIDELKQNGYHKIILVDGGSIDKTVEVAQEKGALIVPQHGSGKRDALETAFELVKTPYVAIMDADMSYDPKDIQLLLSHAKQYDQVVGARRTDSSNMSWLHRIGNRILTFSFNFFFGSKLNDICSGMYLLRTDMARQLRLDGHHFAVEEVILAQTCTTGRAVDVPISYRPRVGRKSTVSSWRQGIIDLLTILDLARKYNPITLFSALSGMALIPAFAILAYVAVQNYLFFNFRSGLALLGVMLLLFAGQAMIVATLSFQMRRIEQGLRALERTARNQERVIEPEQEGI